MPHMSMWPRRATPLRRSLAVAIPFAVAAALPVAAIAAPAPTLTLAEAIARAVQDDPGLRAAAAGIDAARGGLRQARARANPELGIEIENFAGRGSLRGAETAETTFSISQTLDVAGQRAARTRLADRELRSAEQARIIAGLDLIRDVQLAYFDALAAAELVEIAEERVATADALAASVARRVAAARDPLMAGERAKAGAAEARIDLVRAQAEAASSRARLAALIGGDPGIALARDAFALPSETDHPHEPPSDAAPDLAALTAARESARATTALEKSNAWANPTVSFGYRRFEENDGDGAFVAGIAAPIGVFDRNRGGIDRARAEERRAEFAIEAARRALLRDYATLTRTRDTDAAAIRAGADTVIPRAERALSLAQEGYARGAFSYLDVLDAQRALTDARQAQVEALRAFHATEAQLDRLTARFVSSLPTQESHR